MPESLFRNHALKAAAVLGVGGLAIGVGAGTEIAFPNLPSPKHLEKNRQNDQQEINKISLHKLLGKLTITMPKFGLSSPGSVRPTESIPHSTRPALTPSRGAHVLRPSTIESTPHTSSIGSVPKREYATAYIPTAKSGSYNHVPVHYLGSPIYYAQHVSPSNTIANNNINLTYLIGMEMGLSNTEIGCVDNIFANESGFMPNAVNPEGAAGIPQRDPGNGLNYQPAAVQIRWGINYMNSRYGSGSNTGPCNAWAHWQSVAAVNGGAGSY